MKSFLLVSVAVALLSLSACGGGGSIGTPPPQTFTIGGTVSGLTAGTSVVLQNNGGNNLTVSANGSFTFSTPATSYNVTVLTQPTGLNCMVTDGTGTATANVTSVQVACAAVQTFTIGGTVSGVSASGLVLQNNGGDNLSIGAPGSFTFHTPVNSGSTYNVTILTQPTGQTCTVTNGTGTATQDVTTVSVTCVVASTFTISGTVSGLTAAGLVLEDNGGDDLPIGANGGFTFHTPLNSGATYNVTVSSQPTGETCTVANGSGTATANVTNVSVTCSASTSTVTIGGTVSGVTAGGLVLENNGGDDLSIGANGPFTFHTPISAGATYNVTILSQPNNETCTLANASGTANANVTNVTVTCAATVNVTISVVVAGLTSSTTGLVIEDNGINPLPVSGNGTFPITVASGTPYDITVSTQPTGATCTVTNGSGTANTNVTVNVNCVPTVTNFTISAAVSGLSGTVVLQNNGGNNLTVTTNGTFPFTTQIASGGAYAVTVLTQPAGQTCSLGSNASGNATSNVTVAVTCSSTLFTISAAVSGLSGTLVLQDNGGNNLTVTSNGTFPFTTQIASGGAYAVSILTQPAGQTCTLGSNASGNATANVTVSVTCTATATFTISVTTSGLTGTLVMQDDKSDSLTFTTNTTKPFATSYTSGSSYTVSVKTQPTGQNCTLSSNATGTITANVTVTATCTTTTQNFTLSVKTTGLTGTLVVQDNLTDSLTFTSNATQPFATSYASGSSYSVSVVTQPSGQTCSLGSNASGTITADTTVTATCAASGGGPTLSVNITGLSGSVTLTDDQNDTLTFTSNKTQAFATTYTNGSTYTVYVSGQPASQSCIPTYFTGTINSDTTLNAVCATGSTRKLGTVSAVNSVSCSGSIKNGVCQQMTVACPGIPNVFAYIKTNTPSGTSLGTVTYGTGTDGNGLYESIFTFGSTAVQNVLNAGYTTVQISWGTPFNSTQPNGWVEGPSGVLAAACRYATVTQWIYDNIQNDDKTVPYCATANSGGSGALAYALSQYPTASILSMAEVTSGPPTGRLDWGCGCKEGSVNVQCGSSSSLGTCFGTADGPVWDPAYDPTASTGLCTAAVKGTLPPGGVNFFLGDSVEAPGAAYNLSKTHVNLVFGDADNSSAIPIGQDWFNNITSTKSQACVSGGMHSLANTLAGAQQIANDLINMCALQ
jgi:hypothetical protein